MKILHICNNYFGSSVHYKLARVLTKHKMIQYVYVFFRLGQDMTFKNLPAINVSLHEYVISSKLHRFLFKSSSRRVFKNLNAQIEVDKIDFIHAHTLFRNGIIAYYIFKKYKINYAVSIRNTDINVFYKYFFWLRPLANKIIENASQLIFISPKYKENLFNNYISANKKNEISKKSVVIPNGVDQFWLDNLFSRELPMSFVVKVIYVGDLTKNKNIALTIKAIDYLRNKGLQINFTIVGGEADQTKLENLNNPYPWLQYVERTKNIKELLQMYRNADIFCMPSFKETFGLVYVEAMSQGIPVIYSMGQGIDGFFDEGEVGYAVNPNDYLDAAKKIELIIQNYSKLSVNCTKYARNFSWNLIADQIIEVYKNSK